jgi:hypothetical protein
MSLVTASRAGGRVVDARGLGQQVSGLNSPVSPTQPPPSANPPKSHNHCGKELAGLPDASVHALPPICCRRPVDKRCINAAREQFRDAGVVVPPLGFRIARSGRGGHHAMRKGQARESNVFELNVGERAKHIRRRLAERANAELSELDQLMTIVELSPLDELMAILNGRRGH